MAYRMGSARKFRVPGAWRPGCLLAFTIVLACSGDDPIGIPTPGPDIELPAKFGMMAVVPEYLPDGDGVLDPAGAMAAGDWLAAERAYPRFEYTTGTHWVRYRLTNDLDREQVVFHEIRNVLMSRITVHIAREDGFDAPIHAGAGLPFDARPLRNPHHAWSTSLGPRESITVLLEIRHPYDAIVSLLLMSADEYATTLYNKLVIDGVFFGIVVIMVLYNLFLYVSIRDHSYLLYCVYVIAFLFWWLGNLSGYGFQFLWPNRPDLNTTGVLLMAIAAPLFACVFTISFLDLRRRAPGFFLLAMVPVVGLVLLIPGSLFLSYRFAATVLNVLFQMVVPIFIASALVLLLRGYRPARYFLLAFTALMAGATMLNLMLLEYVPYHPMIARGVQIGSALEVLLLSFALGDRVNILRREAQTLKDRFVADLEREVEARTAELNQLNRIARQVNETNNFEDVVDSIFAHLESAYRCRCALLLVDEKQGELYVGRLSSRYMDSAERALIEGARFPLTKESGTIYATYRRRRPFYARRVRASGADRERTLMERIGIQSGVSMPLLLRDEVIGLLLMTGDGETLRLARGDLDSLGRFCNQIGGAIQGASLMRRAEDERRLSDRLLLNILPAEIADELKANDAVRPVRFDSASVMFTDFVGFTRIGEHLEPEELVSELDRCFSYFDMVMERNNLEKLKTIGDSYMCVGGVPTANRSHAVNSVMAALEIQSFMNQMNEIKARQNLPFWELRVGIHTGPLVAGVIGERKFAYDVWGDTVNTASRAETSGRAGRINITQATFDLVEEFFECEHRGPVSVKHKGDIDMYFVNGIRVEYSLDDQGRVPNEAFRARMASGMSPEP